MDKTYAENSIKNYLDDLAARKPAPGGGSACAVEAALGTALMSMVANYTISNKKYVAVKDKASDFLHKSEALRKRLLLLADEDVRAYGRLSEGFKTFKTGAPKLEGLYKSACGVPLDICVIVEEAMAFCAELAEFGNKNLISDTAIAALMLESAYNGALLNVEMNLKYINDKVFRDKVNKVISVSRPFMPKKKKEIMSICRQNI